MSDGQSLMLRGLAKREGDYWASIVLDYYVVGTGDSPEEAIVRSIRMARAYIEEGCGSGKSLNELKRRVPLRIRLDYYYLRFRSRFGPSRMSGHEAQTMPFVRPVPLAVSC
jgi:hypothetical protein